MLEGGEGEGGENSPLPTISYSVTYELFETLMFCVTPISPPSTQTHEHPKFVYPFLN